MIFEKRIIIPRQSCDISPSFFEKQCPINTIRFSIVDTIEGNDICEIGMMDVRRERSIFKFRKRQFERTEKFNVVVIVPTGVDASIGGHAGDAGPIVKMLGSICDTVITHPNVVNASDINEMPENTMYLEGSILDRLLMGTISLEPIRKNKICVIIDKHEDGDIIDLTINAVCAAQATYGLDAIVQVLDTPLRMKATISDSGRATGSIENFQVLHSILRNNDYDAFAIASQIQIDSNIHRDYFTQDMINPWGGVEALLTHAVSQYSNKPSAHAPMCSKEELNLWPGVVDPKKAAEVISTTFLQCVLKGLQRSPRIHLDIIPELFSVVDISCIIVPKGCFGLPHLAAIMQGIPIIEVLENKTLMKNEINSIKVANYWEAAGIIASMKAGIEPRSVRI